MDDVFTKQKHTAFLQNRETIEMSGITEVGAFNEDEVDASSDWGDIIIKGSELHIETLDLETGTLRINGKISAVVYNDRLKSKGIFKKVFSS